MADDVINPDTVLKNHGGAEDKIFAKIINEDRDDDEIDIIRCSPYYVSSSLPSELKPKNGLFSVLSLNAQSLPAKFDGLQAMLELFASQHIYFPVICIQETWIDDESKLPMVSVGDVNQAQCRRAYSRQLVSFNGGRRTAHAPSIVSKVNT